MKHLVTFLIILATLMACSNDKEYCLRITTTLTYPDGTWEKETDYYCGTHRELDKYEDFLQDEVEKFNRENDVQKSVRCARGTKR